MRVRVLPGVPISFTIFDLRLTIFAALVQRQETLRSERRGWGWKSLTRHHFAHVVQRRGVPLKTERLQVQVLPCGPTWNVNRASEPGLGANECVPSGKWCKSTAFRHARVVQREPAVMPRSAQRRPYTPHRTRSVPASGALPDARTIFELLNAKRLKRPSA